MPTIEKSGDQKYSTKIMLRSLLLVKVMNQLLLGLTPPKLNQHLLIITKSDDESSLLVCARFHDDNYNDDDNDNDDDDADDDGGGDNDDYNDNDDDDADDDDDGGDDDAEKTRSEHLIRSVPGPCTVHTNSTTQIEIHNINTNTSTTQMEIHNIQSTDNVATTTLCCRHINRNTRKEIQIQLMHAMITRGQRYVTI